PGFLTVHRRNQMHGSDHIVEVAGGVHPSVEDHEEILGGDLLPVEAHHRCLEDPMEDLPAGQIPWEKLRRHRSGSRGDQL
ncbi:MAG: hypothetical protein JRM85_06825, partial [Nitrososphaerota archaeon]|nr:hypothetical protein [Nitrososphaerota archaeon]